MVLIIFFLLSLVLMKIIFFKQINLNMIVLMTSTLILLMILQKPSRREMFTEDTGLNDIGKIKFLNSLLTDTVDNQGKNGVVPVKTIDDLTSNKNLLAISKDLQLFITTYGGYSYNGFGHTLLNIAKHLNGVQDTISTSQGVISTRDFTFNEQEAAFSVEKGLYLGHNNISGPMSLNLGITGNSEFSIAIICRHDILTASKALINIFKIYGNTIDNNGLTLNIQDAVDSPIPSGKLVLRFDQQQFVSESIPMDPNVMYLYVIQKKPTSIKLTVMSSVDNKPIDVINGNIDSSSDVLFSNKTMCINCFSNWYAYIRAFGIFNVCLNADAIKNIYSYMADEELKLQDSYKDFQDNIKNAQAAIDALKACPYDKDTCGKCTDIKDWTQIDNVLQSGVPCKTAIQKYCAANPSSNLCKCWDKNSSMYNSPACINFRNIFKDITVDVATLDDKTLAEIKTKYDLVDKSTACTGNQPGELLTVGITSDQLKKQLQDNPSALNVMDSGSNVILTDSKSNVIVTDPSNLSKSPSSGPVSNNSVPANQPIHNISVPVVPTPSGFKDWLASWF